MKIITHENNGIETQKLTIERERDHVCLDAKAPAFTFTF